MKLSSGHLIYRIPSLEITAEQRVAMEKWIAALRSNKYVQGRGYLKDANSEYCCFGVGCDVFHKETGNGRWVEGVRGFLAAQECLDEYASRFFFPKEVEDYFGMGKEFLVKMQRHDDPKIVGSYSLNHLNDFKEADFNDIANILEASLNGGLELTISSKGVDHAGSQHRTEHSVDPETDVDG